MSAQTILEELASLGSDSIKKIWAKHGAQEPFFGVKIEFLKKIQKRIKHDHDLALALWASGNGDAMYLAGLISQPQKMTKTQLNQWVKTATWYMLSEYTVAWTASESRFATELAREWMKSKKEAIQSTGWATYSSYIAVTPDEDLNLDEIKELLHTIETNIHQSANRVRYTMNGFVIAVAGYVIPLMDAAKQTAKAIGKVSVDMGDTACKVPLATEYIAKLEKMGRVGKKRKTAFC